MYFRLFTLGYYSTGFQMGIEVTYPVSEGTSTAAMFFAGNLTSFVLTVIYGYTIKLYGDLASNIGMMVIYGIAVAITISIPADMKRQKAETVGNTKEMVYLI